MCTRRVSISGKIMIKYRHSSALEVGGSLETLETSGFIVKLSQRIFHAIQLGLQAANFGFQARTESFQLRPGEMNNKK